MIKILEGFTSNIIILLFYIFLKCVLLFPFTSYPCKWLMMNDWCLIYVFRTLFSSGTALKSRTENRWQVQHNLASMLRCQRFWVPPPASISPELPRTTQKYQGLPITTPHVGGLDVWCAASLGWQLFVSIRLAAAEMCISNGG